MTLKKEELCIEKVQTSEVYLYFFMKKEITNFCLSSYQILKKYKLQESKENLQNVYMQVNSENKSADSDEIIVAVQEYSLTAVVCFINEPNSIEKKNLVALIKVPVASQENTNDHEYKWFLFNDFSISHIRSQEAVWFSLDWKTPCVLYYSLNELLSTKTTVVTALSKVLY